jgi:hypothetical protein
MEIGEADKVLIAVIVLEVTVEDAILIIWYITV